MDIRRGSWLVPATLAALVSLTAAQGSSPKLRLIDPAGRPLPLDLFVIRDAQGVELRPQRERNEQFSFSGVGRKVSFEFTQKGLKAPGFDLVLEEAPTVWVSMVVDPFTGKLKSLTQKAERPPLTPKKVRGARLGLQAPPLNDACEDALPLLDGNTAFSTLEATTDGAPTPGAQYDGQTYEDIWYLYTPSCNGTLTASTCGTADYDTDLVLYEADADGDGDHDAIDCALITSGAAPALAANDDAGNCAGFTSVVSAPITADRQYLVRVGGFAAGHEGTGTLQVSCQGPPANDLCSAALEITCGDELELTSSAATGSPSDPAFSCAFAGPTRGDGSLWFRFTAESTSASLSTAASTGVADTLLAVYSGSCGALTELACDDDGGLGLLSELCVDGLTVGESYLVQVASFPGADLGRLTLTLDCPGPCEVACDDIAAACLLPCGGELTVDNSNAGTDSLDPAFSCRFGGADQGVGSLWFRFVAAASSARLDTNASSALDTLLAVYAGTPGALTELACSDDEGDGLRSELCVEGLTPGQTYYVQAAAFSAFDVGEITVALTCPCSGAFPNDECTSALALANLPASVTVDLSLAGDDGLDPCGVSSGPFANVWYRVSGTGNVLTASTCNAGTLVHDTKIAVYCADCGTLVCVAGNDDGCDAGGPPFASTVQWCSQAGASYLITVGTFSPNTARGLVQLDVADTGSACAPEVQCLPQGACCLSDGSCATLTPEECAVQGGTYGGDGTACTSQLVADGGFERGAFGGDWDEFSTNFGSPICDAACGFGGGSGAHSGGAWAWFGGVFGFEEGHLEQSVIIPADADALTFQLEIPVSSGNGVDVLRVRIDGTTVFEVFEGDAAHAGVGYDPVSIPLGALADGAAHLVRFEATTTGLGPGGAALTNFFVDDVSIEVASFDCARCYTLDFEHEDDFETPLVNGQAIAAPDEFGTLVVISAAGANAGATVFDSTPGGPNDPALNDDMLIGHGNLLLLQDGARAGQSAPGVFDHVTDDPQGGDLVFDFVAPVDPESLLLVDINPPPNKGASVTLHDAAGRTRVYTIPPGWTGAYGDAGPWRLDLRATTPQVGNLPGLKLARAVQSPGFEQENVVRIVVHLTGFGALDELVFCR